MLDLFARHGSLDMQVGVFAMSQSDAGTKMAEPAQSSEYFRLERHGDIAVLMPSPHAESLSESLIYQAADLVLAPLRDDPPAGLVIDLSQVQFFGSIFLSFLLRCYLLVKKHGSEVVVAGANDKVRELLHVTALDTLWAIYDSRAEAMEVLGGSD